MKTKKRIFSALIICLMIGSAFIANAQQPSRAWATYYGQESNEFPFSSVSAGDNNDVYLGGTSNNPVTGNDGLIMKFNSQGQMIWQTEILGTGSDNVVDVKTYSSFVYVVGATFGGAIPNAAGSYSGGWDIFVAKLNISDGSIIWVRYYGGSNDDHPTAITAHGNGPAICGFTLSTSGIAYGTGFQMTKSGLHDGFIATFNLTGSLVWGSYYGGSNNDKINDIAINGSTYVVAGNTYSSNIIPPVSGNSYSGNGDAFVAKISYTGSKNWEKYFGGPDLDEATGIESSAYGIYICGQTNSTSGIIMSGGYRTTKSSSLYRDIFLARFSDLGTQLNGTYYGDDAYDWEYVNDIEITNYNTILITGKTKSITGIVTPGTWQTSIYGLYEGFISSFNNTLSTLNWGTYYGSYDDDNCKSIDTKDNKIYIAGLTKSQYLPTQVAYDNTLVEGNTTGLFAKFIDWNCVPFTVTVTNLGVKPSGCQYISNPSGGTSPYTYLWTTGETTQSVIVQSGTPNVMTTDANGCTSYPMSYPVPCGSGPKNMVIENTQDFNVYPNPVTDIMTIESDGAEGNVISLYDVMGKQVMAVMLSPGETSSEVNVSELSNGVYNLKLENEHGLMKTFRIVVSH